MYRLPQDGILAQKLINQYLNEKGNRQSRINPGYWKHDQRQIYFTLFVDNFGMGYVGKEHANHLVTELKEH